MFLLILLSSLLVGLQGPQRSAKEMFYAPTGADTSSGYSNNTGLRPVPLIQPFPRYGRVGVHYWFTNDRGAIMSEAKAAAEPAGLTLHVRSNTEGFLSVWSLAGMSGAQLTPTVNGRPSIRILGGTDYAVPGQVSFNRNTPVARLIIVFSRAQTEQASSVDHASARLATISEWADQDGPWLVRETDNTTPGEIGNYVVNRRGAPVASEIVLQATPISPL